MPTIYRKYRPKRFSEISGQGHIVRTLTNAVLKKRIGHAYLFTGPRGTGKTTLARIFAKTINCIEPEKQKTAEPMLSKAVLEPCDKCENCKLISKDKAIDIIEIDAASHTGVDNIRQLKEAIPLPPTSLKYKVYIIDEVHMLSAGAFNALLKTLEEPPSHAIFILATTELHKVPETIVSRCQRFEVANLSTQQIIERLGQIAKAEKVEIEDEALETIALEAEGGMRDAESLFGQILSLEDKKINATQTNAILGTSPRPLAIEFVHELLRKKTKECLEKIDLLEKEGVNLKNFNKLILVYLRNLLLIKTNPNAKGTFASSLSKEQIEKSKEELQKTSLASIVFLIELFQKSILRFKESTIPQLPLELAVIEFHLSFPENKSPQEPARNDTIPSSNSPVHTAPSEPPRHPEKQSAETLPHAEQANPDKPSKPSAVKTEAPNKTQETKTPETQEQEGQTAAAFDKNLSDILDIWSDVLEKVKPQNHSISAFLKNCTPCGIKQNTIYIKTKYDFYKDKLSEIDNRLTVQKAIGTIIGAVVQVAFITERECSSIDFENNGKSEKNHNVLHDAMQVFGGRIVK